MPTVALLMLQAAAVLPPPTSPSPPPPPSGAAGISLLHPIPSANCAARADEIVVCGRDGDSYRLPQTASQPEVNGLPRAEWKLPNGTAIGIHADQREVGGYSSPAAMVTIKIPF